MRHGNLLSRVKIIARIYNLHIFVEIYYGDGNAFAEESGTGSNSGRECHKQCCQPWLKTLQKRARERAKAQRANLSLWQCENGSVHSTHNKKKDCL